MIQREERSSERIRVADKDPREMPTPATDLYWTELRIFLQVARSKSFNKRRGDLG
jgi:hypothetical protein